MLKKHLGRSVAELMGYQVGILSLGQQVGSKAVAHSVLWPLEREELLYAPPPATELWWQVAAEFHPLFQIRLKINNPTGSGLCIFGRHFPLIASYRCHLGGNQATLLRGIDPPRNLCNLLRCICFFH